ncbi:DUF58 domain-containing protein [Natronosalvus vescus]|uniref:DUF58 domain-containing protein n=1 Tax=Natronosalvus vescus TaxID=2953881 RepID=UPI0020909857|nr:DUF58 domain-containing protein [Natronosalvus vescus]
MSRRLPRWQGALVVTLLVSLAAVLLGAPALFMLGVVPLGYVLVSIVSADPATTLSLERTIDDDRPRPGQPIRVTLSMTNEGDRVLPDVRLNDVVPDDVPVIDGSSATATAIRPGETVTHEYELLPPRGEYQFGSPRVRVRNLASSALDTLEPDVDGTTSFTCETLLDSFSLHDQTIQYVGRTPTDDGGNGIEFYAAREYRHGDPINRIDWHRLARTGELATIEHREERAVTMVFLVDDRRDVHRGSLSGGPDSFDLTLYAASRGLLASLEDGNRTGFGLLQHGSWIDPGSGSDVRQRVEETIDDEAPHRIRADGGRLAIDIENRLPRNAQVVFCSPLTDDTAVDLIEYLRLRGRAVTVISPDMTTSVSDSESATAIDATTNTPPGAMISRLERRNRLDELRGLGSTVVDWNLAEPLSVDIVRALRSTGVAR